MSVATAPAELTDEDARRVAESLFAIEIWNGIDGRIVCPGLHLHTTPSAVTDCHVMVQPFFSEAGRKPPGCYCRHKSCLNVCHAESERLRSELGKVAWKKSPVPPSQRKLLPPRPQPLPKPFFRPDMLEPMAAKMGEDFRHDPYGYLAARSRKQVDNRTVASCMFDLFQSGEKVLMADVYNSQGSEVWEHPGGAYDARVLDHFLEGGPKGRCCGVWFLSAPITGEWLPRPEPDKPNKKTRRDERCVTSWRHVLLESDDAPADQWLAMLCQLELPIVSLTTSGAKSVHALVKVGATSKAEFDDTVAKMKRPLITLGADNQAMSGVRFTRAPLCLRHGKMIKDPSDPTGKSSVYSAFEQPRQQRLLYLNPYADRTPICELSTL